MRHLTEALDPGVSIFAALDRSWGTTEAACKDVRRVGCEILIRTFVHHVGICSPHLTPSWNPRWRTSFAT